jgi:hypothetical protein
LNTLHSGSAIAAFLIFSARLPANGLIINFEGSEYFIFRNRRILHLLQHAGVFPPPRNEREDDMMCNHEKTLTQLFLFALTLSALTLTTTIPVFAAVTHSGAAISKITVVTETNPQTTSSTSFVDLPGAAAVITVPAGKKQLVQARFVGESACMPVSGGNYWCSIQIVAVSTSKTTPLLPDSGVDAAFDTVPTSQDSWEGHAVERSVVLPEGKYTIKAQWVVTDPTVTFALDDWTFTVTQYGSGK